MLSKTIIFLVFLAAMSLSILMVAMGGLLGVVYSLPVSLVAAYCLFRGLMPGLVDKFFWSIFLPDQRNKLAPMLLSPIEAKIAREQYQEAIAELEELLTRHPLHPTLVARLSDLYLFNLKQPRDAYALLAVYLESRTVFAPEDKELIMNFVDLCLELNRKNEARKRLEAEILKSCPEPVRKALSTRLANL